VVPLKAKTDLGFVEVGSSMCFVAASARTFLLSMVPAPKARLASAQASDCDWLSRVLGEAKELKRTINAAIAINRLIRKCRETRTARTNNTASE
jgi:hypothetical protein